MKSNKGITKSDLLVILACITLVLLNLGGLGSAGRERARRIVCATNMTQLMRANHMYADNWDEQFCPPMMVNGTMPDAPKPDVSKPPSGWENALRKLNWISNPDFRKYMGLDEKQVSKYDNVMPREYQCPTNIIFKEGQPSSWNILVSYAYNVTDWPDEVGDYWDEAGTPSVKQWLIGHKRTAIPHASEKINFIDSTDWWCTWYGANYVKGWDIIGHGEWEDYESVGIYGPVLYRHNDGANLAFYDGHIEHLPKEKVFVDTDGNPTNANTKDATEMWYVIWP